MGDEEARIFLLYFPLRGSCALCGDPDANHRLFDAIRSHAAAGDPIAAIALDYGLPPAVVEQVLQVDKMPRKA